ARRVEVQDVVERRELSLVHVGRGARDVAQRWSAELSPLLGAGDQVLDLACAIAARIIAETAGGVEGILQQLRDSFAARGVARWGLVERRRADVVELAVAEEGTDVTRAAACFADEELQAARGGLGILRSSGAVVVAQSFDVAIEGGVSAHELSFVR